MPPPIHVDLRRSNEDFEAKEKVEEAFSRQALPVQVSATVQNK